MCVCMDAEANEVNDNRVLAGKEIIKVYTRKNRNAKLRDSANGERSPSLTPPNNNVCREDDVTNQARVDALAGQERNFSEQRPLAAGLKGESSSLDISKVHDEDGSGEEALADGQAQVLPSSVKEFEDRTRISCGDEAGLQILSSCQPERCEEPMSNSDLEAEMQIDIPSRQEPSAVEAYVSNSTEDLRQLPNDRGGLLPSGGKVKMPSGGPPGPHSCELDRYENHQVADVRKTGLSKPLISMVEDRVFIDLSESRSKDETRSLMRKLEVELDQVRRVTRKVDEKKLQVAAYNERNMTNPAGFTVSDVSVYNQPHLARVGSSLDSLGHLQTRSLGYLSVPMVEKNHHVDEFVERVKRTPNIFAHPHSTMVTSSVPSVRHVETTPYRHLSVSVPENNHEIGEFLDQEKRMPKANPYYMNSDFYLNIDRLPPESHNKIQKAPGAVKKNSFGGEYGGVAFAFGGDKDGNKLFKDCSNLLQRLMKHKNGWVFNSPVDPLQLGVPDYFDIIKHPMDLGTIKTKLAKKQYKSAMEFIEDIRLVFSNAMTYNPKGHEVHTMAEELSKIFEDRWASIQNGFSRKKYNKAGYFPSRRHHYPPPPLFAPAPPPAPPLFAPAPPAPPLLALASPPLPVNSMVRPANCNITRVRRTPALQKPKANDLNKRDMSSDEKQKLSTNLQSLPTDRLDAIVQIIKKRNTTFSQNDDEIEVDIDSVDSETLWELDRYVSNFKKSLSKYRRRAELAAQQAQAAATKAIHETNEVPSALVSQKESIIGDGITNSAPIQVESHANGTASSCSSSSSSDSGSSSSDSDSDSSSTDELDIGGHSPGA